MSRNFIGTYGNFITEKYVLEKFGFYPSSLTLNIDLDDAPQMADKIFASATENEEAAVILESWNVSAYKDDRPEKDYIDMYFIEIPRISVCMEIDISKGEFSIEYLYDCKNEAAREWVQKTYRKIRETFSSVVTPTFKVLSRMQGEYNTEPITISNVDTDIDTNYNSDFKEIDTIIQNALKTDRSGLILLHGKPGTGKTTYIKYLLSIHHEKNFIFIPNDFIIELLQPDFISFLLTQRNTIIVIEDAEKVISSRERINNDSVVSTILQLTDGLFSDYLNIKIICTFNTNLSNIDRALLRKGRMIAFYEFAELSVQKTNTLLATLGLKPANQQMTLADIYNLSSTQFYQDINEIGFKKKK